MFYHQLVRLMAEEGALEAGREPTAEERQRFDRHRPNKKVSNRGRESPTDPDSRIARTKDGRTHLAYKAEHVGRGEMLPTGFPARPVFAARHSRPRSAVRAALRAVRETGVATATVNHYLTAIKTFSRWLWRQGRLASDPLVGLSRQNADVDRRHLRRVLSPAEFAQLVEAAENSPRVFRGLAGPDRAALYMLAGGSGLRASELASVTRATLLLEAEPPRVQVQAAYAKNKRDDTVPLPVEVADYLRQWLASRGTVPLDRQTRLWPGKWYRRAADMLKADLAEAGIPYELDGQVFDFHALRAQYATLLGQQGVNLQTAQALLRHSDPKLTARTYTKLGITDLASTVQGIRLRGADKDRRAVQG